MTDRLAGTPLERALAAKNAHAEMLLALPGVLGIKLSLGSDGKPCVRIFSEKHARIRGLPKELDGTPTVVTVTGPIVAA